MGRGQALLLQCHQWKPSLPIPNQWETPRWSEESPSPLTSQQVWEKTWQSGFISGTFLLTPKCQCLWTSHLHPISMSKEHLICTDIPVFCCSLKTQKSLFSLSSDQGTGCHIKGDYLRVSPVRLSAWVLRYRHPALTKLPREADPTQKELHHTPTSWQPACFPNSHKGSHKSSSAYS